jgi:hypothetical protein
MSTAPIETLQLRAMEQRGQLHQTATEIREKIDRTRDKFRIKNQVREHLVTFCIAGAALAVLIGYGVVSLFTRD